MDETQAAEIQRGLGRVESALQSQAEWQRGHDVGDQREFAEIRRNFAAQDKRLSAMEGLCTMVEGHGEAIVNVESRLTESEEREQIRITRSDANAKWLKWIFFIVAAIALDRFTPQLLGVLSAIKP
jgi:hypothetical protein